MDDKPKFETLLKSVDDVLFDVLFFAETNSFPSIQSDQFEIRATLFINSNWLTFLFESNQMNAKFSD